MIYVVEIQSPGGGTATKEYEGCSIREVMQHAQLDLRDYPDFYVLHVTARPYVPRNEALNRR
jgi:hypothetical protein